MKLFIFSDVPLNEGPLYMSLVVAEDEFAAVTQALQAGDCKLQQLLEKGIASSRFTATEIDAAFREHYPHREERELCDDALLVMLINGSVQTTLKTASI